MAIIDPDQLHTIDIPDEPGQWVKYRVLTPGRIEGLEDRTSVGFAAAAIDSWSYSIPPTPDTIRHRLDLNTFHWLVATINDKSGILSDPESNGSEPPHSPTSEPVEGDSPQSSGT